jgi:hypothetical protein
MNKRKIQRSAIVLYVIIAGLIGLLIWIGTRPPKISPRPMANSDERTNPIVGEFLSRESQQKESLATGTNVSVGKVSRKDGVAALIQDKLTEKRAGLARINDVPIVFNGRLEDQYGDPVADARIDASVRVYNGFRSTVERFNVSTDANGMFHIDHGKGESLGIAPSKEGYVVATSQTHFNYSHFMPKGEQYHPNPNNPTVIKMWKLQGAQPLIAINKQHKLSYTDKPVHFDLLAGQIVTSGGDIMITVNRSEGVVSSRTMQDWSVQVEAVDGGLVRTDIDKARATYILPEDGYQLHDMFIMSTNPPHKWFGGIDQMYFVRSRGGKVYSKVNVSVAINHNPGDPVWVEFRGSANPNGGRNFEADAQRMHRP